MAIDVLTNADLSKYSERRLDSGLSESRAAVKAFPYTEVWHLLERYGGVENYKFPSGGGVIVLPTCSVPLGYLDRKNWGRVIHMGNFREVKAIRILDEVTKPAVVVKSPERVLTRDHNKLEKGSPWWGGRRSKERPIYIGDNPVVEEQVLWEAITLLELRRQGIRAEVPQAFIQHQDGKIELIVQEINSPREPTKTKGPSWDDIFDRVAKTGLVPVDSGGHNCLIDEDENIRLIDVNRWLWPPYTDNYRARLLAAVATAVATASS